MKRIFLLITAAAVVCLSVAAQNQKVMNGKNTLVAYFSATGITEKVAEMIAETTGGDLYEITPVQEYTATDLDWTDKTSRSTKEMNDSKSRPAIRADLKDAESYDVIYIGYPIWWNLAPRARAASCSTMPPGTASRPGSAETAAISPAHYEAVVQYKVGYC